MALAAEESPLVDMPLPDNAVLLEAMADNRLELWFQPVVDLITRRPVWFEGLLRLRTREGQILPPGRFIPQAEREPALISAIDAYVMRLAVQHLTAGELPRLSVNVSGVTMADPEFAHMLEGYCGPLTDTQRANLILEVTETAMIRDLEAAKVNSRTARLLGLDLAMDDFGEAFSSMMILRELPFSILKIHGSFAQQLRSSQKCWLITDWMRRLGAELGMQCVLEFISDEDLAQEALKMDFTLGQGFHLGKPQPLNDIQDAVAARQAQIARENTLLAD